MDQKSLQIQTQMLKPDRRRGPRTSSSSSTTTLSNPATLARSGNQTTPTLMPNLMPGLCVAAVRSLLAGMLGTLFLKHGGVPESRWPRHLGRGLESFVARTFRGLETQLLDQFPKVPFAQTLDLQQTVDQEMRELGDKCRQVTSAKQKFALLTKRSDERYYKRVEGIMAHQVLLLEQALHRAWATFRQEIDQVPPFPPCRRLFLGPPQVGGGEEEEEQPLDMERLVGLEDKMGRCVFVPDLYWDQSSFGLGSLCPTAGSAVARICQTTKAFDKAFYDIRAICAQANATMCEELLPLSDAREKDTKRCREVQAALSSELRACPVYLQNLDSLHRQQRFDLFHSRLKALASEELSVVGFLFPTPLPLPEEEDEEELIDRVVLEPAAPPVRSVTNSILGRPGPRAPTSSISSLNSSDLESLTTPSVVSTIPQALRVSSEP